MFVPSVNIYDWTSHLRDSTIYCTLRVPGTGPRAWCTFHLVLKTPYDVGTIMMPHYKDEETEAPKNTNDLL